MADPVFSVAMLEGHIVLGSAQGQKLEQFLSAWFIPFWTGNYYVYSIATSC